MRACSCWSTRSSWRCSRSGCSASSPTGCSAGRSTLSPGGSRRLPDQTPDSNHATAAAGDGTMTHRTMWLAALAALIGFAAAPADAQRPIKMTIATGVDPAFSQFYVAKEAGLFERNGLDVQINTGASGSAMVPFLINNQINAAYGSDLAGVINHNIDANVVAVADGTYLRKWLSVVAKDVADLDALKGKRVGIAKGT